jgi:hypothetical protein
VKKQFCHTINHLGPKEKIIFLSRKIFGTDICNSTGYHGGRFRLEETDTEFVFTLDPCGSGGRLVRFGSYKPIPWIRKKGERIEKAVICSASQLLPMPEILFVKIFPFFVNHFTQRKPHHQGKTKASHSWSFSMNDVPYFCCQCGMIHEQCSNKGIRIYPPTGKTKRCIWRIDKNLLGAL